MKRALILGDKETLRIYSEYKDIPELISLLIETGSLKKIGIFIDTKENVLYHVNQGVRRFDLNDFNQFNEHAILSRLYLLFNSSYTDPKMYYYLLPNFNEDDLYEYFLGIASNERVCETIFEILCIYKSDITTISIDERVISIFLKAINNTNNVLYKRMLMKVKLGMGAKIK